jgi:TfoX/Sxy family transcriptional regulator of competence genes
MAYDEDHAEILRQALFDEPNITEKKMFGGLCFLKNGNMVCGVHKGGGMARVGKIAEPEALEIEGISTLSFTGRPMGGMVDVSPHVFDNTRLCGQIIDLALAYARTLPAKVAKPRKPR